MMMNVQKTNHLMSPRSMLKTKQIDREVGGEFKRQGWSDKRLEHRLLLIVEVGGSVGWGGHVGLGCRS